MSADGSAPVARALSDLAQPPVPAAASLDEATAETVRRLTAAAVRRYQVDGGAADYEEQR